MVEEVMVTFDQKMILEIEEIMVDKNKDAALKFIERYIYKLIRKQKESHCKPKFR